VDVGIPAVVEVVVTIPVVVDATIPGEEDAKEKVKADPS